MHVIGGDWRRVFKLDRLKPSSLTRRLQLTRAIVTSFAEATARQEPLYDASQAIRKFGKVKKVFDK